MGDRTVGSLAGGGGDDALPHHLPAPRVHRQTVSRPGRAPRTAFTLRSSSPSSLRPSSPSDHSRSVIDVDDDDICSRSNSKSMPLPLSASGEPEKADNPAQTYVTQAFSDSKAEATQCTSAEAHEANISGNGGNEQRRPAQTSSPPPLAATTASAAVAPPSSLAASHQHAALEAYSAAVDVFARMDASQRAAACFTPDAPLLIQAGAGSGKTLTMASRVAYLMLHGVPAQHLLGICFTRQAAETLRLRVQAVLPEHLHSQARALKLKTLHAFGLECLRRFGRIDAQTEVYDARRQRKLVQQVVQAHAVHSRSAEAVEALLDYINRVKSRKAESRRETNPSMQEAYLYPMYQQALHEVANAVDFGDLLQIFCSMLQPTPRTTAGAAPSERETALIPSDVCLQLQQQFTHIVVDEFQDFSAVQFEILALLAGDACRVTCVGDPNQCIYAWRGAMPDIFSAWCSRFPVTEQRVLGLNYRSASSIVRATNDVVQTQQQASGHHDTDIRPVLLVECETDVEEQQAVPFIIENVLRRRDAGMRYGDIAVLCRTRRRVQLFTDLLQQHHIPVAHLKGTAPDRLSSLRVLLAYLQLILNPLSNADVRTVLGSAPSHLAAKALNDLCFSLDAVCQARLQAEQQQQQQSPSLSTSAAVPTTATDNRGAGTHAHAARHAYFTVLQELVYHNFSLERLPKLALSKANQRVVRAFVRVVLEAQALLASGGVSGVEAVLRYVASAAGYGDTAAASTAGRAKRKRGRGTAGIDVAAAVAADLSSAPSPPPPQSPRQAAAVSSSARRSGVADDEAGLMYSEAEEQALLAEAKGGTVMSVLLQALATVHAQIDEERQRDAQPTSDSAVRVAAEVPVTATMVLRRVLDEFLSLLPSDDFGSFATVSADEHGGRAAAAPVCAGAGCVTVGTVHRAKGMEWPAVILAGCWIGEFPSHPRQEEERRVFYVAMSRAMRDLVLVTARRALAPEDTLGESATAGRLLQRTPYLTAIEKNLDKKAFNDMKEEHLREKGAF